MRIILVLCVVLCFYILQRKIYVNNCFKKLETKLNFSCSGVFVGENLNLTLTVSNKKLMPLWWVGIRYSLSRKLKFIEDENQNTANDNYRKDMFFMMPYERLTRNHTLAAVQRGYFIIDEMDLNSGDLFGDVRLLKQVKCGTQLYVYPKLVETEQFSMLFNKINGDIIMKRQALEDPFQLRGIREYTPFDSMKRVNWSATAKSLELKVNQFDSTCSAGVTILLNVEKFNNFDSLQLIEEGISIVASIASRFAAQGVDVELFSNGEDEVSGEMSEVEAGSNESKEIEILEALARLRIDKLRTSLSGLLQSKITTYAQGRVIFIVSHYYNERVVDFITSKLMQGYDIRWIMPKNSNEEAPLDGIRELYYWEVN